MNQTDELKYAQMFSHWYSWGSPVGLGVFILSIVLAIFIGASALNLVVDAGQKGVDIQEQIAR